MSNWTMNVSAAKKDLPAALDLELQKTEAQNFYDNEAKVVKPVVEAILKEYKVPNDEVVVTVNVSSGGVGGRTGLSFNVNW